MYTSQRAILILSVIAILLMVLMTVLLLNEKDTTPETEYQTTSQESVEESPEPEYIEVAPSVSQDESEELPLGTDINMEFPTIDE